MEKEKTHEKEELSFEEKIEVYEETLQKCHLNLNGDTSQIPILTDDEEIEVAKRIEEGEERYEDYLLVANLRFACKTAKEIYDVTSSYHNLEKEDLTQEGILGLKKAIKKFDHKKGFKFLTYAEHWISQSINRHIENHGRMIRIPVAANAELVNYNKAINNLYIKLERLPSTKDIAQEMNIPLKKAFFLKNLSERSIASTDKVMQEEDEGESWIMFYEEINSESAEKVAISNIQKEDIEKILKDLTPEEQIFLKERFALDRQEPKTLQEIGDKLDTSRERARQMQEKILGKLRKSLIQKEPEFIKKILNKFNLKERAVLELRLGLKSGKTRARAEVKKITGFDTKKIKEIEEEGLKKIAPYFIGHID